MTAEIVSFLLGTMTGAAIQAILNLKINKRIKERHQHDWDNWKENSDYYQQRKCKTCGWTQEREL